MCIHVCIFGGDEIECYLSIQGMYGYIQYYMMHIERNLLIREQFVHFILSDGIMSDCSVHVGNVASQFAPRIS